MVVVVIRSVHIMSYPLQSKAFRQVSPIVLPTHIFVQPQASYVDMRKLKYHEQKLLKKVDFLQWKSDQNIREIQVQLDELMTTPLPSTIEPAE